jgi:hypothetical protein
VMCFRSECHEFTYARSRLDRRNLRSVKASKKVWNCELAMKRIMRVSQSFAKITYEYKLQIRPSLMEITLTDLSFSTMLLCKHIIYILRQLYESDSARSSW